MAVARSNARMSTRFIRTLPFSRDSRARAGDFAYRDDEDSLGIQNIPIFQKLRWPEPRERSNPEVLLLASDKRA